MTDAERASNLLNDDFFANQLKKLMGSYYDIIGNSGAFEYEERENAYRMIKAIQAIESHFESIASEKAIFNNKLKILQQHKG
jgi:hypothetical protein|tara:strand:+ start:665 stop:910 length:246 start_codon:yes stop_codon:yes gene_type:complete